MPHLLGPVVAFGASVSWAYASVRYAHVSRDAGSVRINFARAATAFPIFATIVAWTRWGTSFEGVTTTGCAILLVSVLGSYAMADSLFFTAARRIGVTTASSIASLYPLWAALYGALVEGEPFGIARGIGTLLAVGGIVWLVRLAGGDDPGFRGRRDMGGFLLAGVTSLLWAANTAAVKRGAVGLDIPQVSAIRYGMAFVLLLPQLYRTRESTLRLRTWFELLPALLVDTVLGSTCYVYGLSNTDLAVGATMTSLAPLISVPVAVALGEETWSVRRLGAIATTVGGIVLLVTSGRT